MKLFGVMKVMKGLQNDLTHRAAIKCQNFSVCLHKRGVYRGKQFSLHRQKDRLSPDRYCSAAKLGGLDKRGIKLSGAIEKQNLVLGIIGK